MDYLWQHASSAITDHRAQVEMFKQDGGSHTSDRNFSRRVKWHSIDSIDSGLGRDEMYPRLNT